MRVRFQLQLLAIFFSLALMAGYARPVHAVQSETRFFTSDQALHVVATTGMTGGLGLLMENAWETKQDAIWRAAAATFVIFTIKELFIDDTFSVGDEVFNAAGAATGALILYEIQF